MRRFSRLLLACVAILALVFAGTAYAANTTELSIAQIRQDGGVLYLYLTGVNDIGEAALDTGAWNDYTVTMNGTQLPIMGVDACETLKESVHYIVCVDISKSISSKTGEREYVKDAVNEMIERLQSNEVMTLFTFGNNVTNIVSFTSDKTALHAAVNDIEYTGDYTALYEVINESTKFAWNNRTKAERTVVLIITDGTDDANGGSTNYTYETIREDVKERNVPVYTATFYRSDSAGGAESLNQLRDLAAVSGGRLSSLSKGDEGFRITGVVTNLQDLTRKSTRLAVQLTSDLEHGDGNFEASMATNGGMLQSPEHSFTVSWNDVPAPTPEPDTTLDILEIDDITEDSTLIRGTTEAGSTVRIDRNGEFWAEFPSTDGAINYSFKSQLDESFHLNKGDVITVSAVDASGNSKLANGSDSRVRKTVGDSSRADITVQIDGIGEDGYVYGDSMTVRGTAQENTQVLVTWQPDAGDRMVYGPISTRGKTYSFTMNADDCELGTGTVVVLYADYLASSRQGYYEGAVNWIREKPIEEVPVVLELPTSISEDSKSIRIHTEPNAEVCLIVDGTMVDLGENAYADESGNWEYVLVNNDDVILRKDRKIKIEVTDAFGRVAESEEITIEGSTRRDISVNVSHMSDDVFYGETIKIQGTAERDTAINVSIWDFSSQTLLGSKRVDSSGNFMAEFSAEDCGITGENGYECYVQAEYADNLAESKTYVGTSFIWIGHAQVEKKEARLEVKSLREDSETLRIQSEPNTEVSVVNITQDAEIASGITDSNGVIEWGLGAAGVATVRQDDEIQVNIVYEGEEKSTTVTVGEAKREQITVKVKGLDANARINQEFIVIQGIAEPNTELEISWMANAAGATADPETITTTVNQAGYYEATLSKDSFTEGYGSIRVSYVDGLAASKQGNLSEGQIEWIQVTPTPIVTPPPIVTPSADVETPTPTPTSTPTPTPTPLVGVMKMVNDFTETFHNEPARMVRDWHFWVIVVVALLVIALIVLLIITLIRRSKQKRTVIVPSDDDSGRVGPYSDVSTVRQREPAEGSTLRDDSSDLPGYTGGTVNMYQENQDQNPDSYAEGTVRLSASNSGEVPEGTVRITTNMGPQPMLVRVHQSNNASVNDKDSTLSILEEATIGRAGDNDLVIDDKTVSGHHMKLIRRENELFALDMMSSNGTILNGERISVETKLNSGDSLLLGRTTLTFEFD